MNNLSNEKCLEIFRKMVFIRQFEKEIIKASNKSFIKCPVYLSIGQESISSTISSFFKPDLIFAQHRAHSVYLSFGGDPSKLIDELLGRTSGCSEGKGGSPGIQSKEIGMVGHHGLIGENVPLAVGAALGDKTKKVVCFFGDGAAEEDYVFTAIAFAATHKLPVLFVCEDNNLSILTKKSERRNWELTDAVKAIGITAVDTTDNPLLIADYIEKFKDNLPAFINCRTCRHRWHSGVGIDNNPECDSLELFKQQISEKIATKEIEELEAKTKKEVEELWEKHLQKQ